MLKLYCSLKVLACILITHFKLWMMNYIAKFYIQLGISRQVLWRELSTDKSKRNERNDADDDVPPVLPHQLVEISTSDFVNMVVDMHLPQLRHSWNEETIMEIENQHRQLRITYCEELALKSALDKYEEVPVKSFDTAWAIVEGRFEILRDFCGGIATVFPNTASVESDFSILSWEKDKYRLSITDLSLEGIMHCKQYDVLSSLV